MRLINTYKLGWFSTSRDKAARDLLATVNSSIKLGEIKAEMTFVFFSREPGESEGCVFLPRRVYAHADWRRVPRTVPHGPR